MIAVTGIASVELNKVGPFLQRAFSDYGYLTQRPEDVEKENAVVDTTSTAAAAAAAAAGGKGIDDTTTSKKLSVGLSRLRRFRS